MPSCQKCGTQCAEGAKICQNCGSPLETTLVNQTASQPRSQTKPTRAWYLAPLLLSIIGGIIGYFVVKNEDKYLANRLLVIGIVILVLETCAAVVTAPALTMSPYSVKAVATTANSEQLILDRYNFPVGGPLTVTLKNVGSVSENLQNADYYVNGILANATASGCSAGSTLGSVSLGGSCVVVVSVPLTSLAPEAAYPFKVVTSTGTVFLYSVFYGPSG